MMRVGTGWQYQHVAKRASATSTITPASSIEQLLELTNPQPPVRVLDLISQFTDMIENGDMKSVNETTIRETFLNPLLEDLGWDPRNRRGVAVQDRDVILEDSLVIDGETKAPDYAFVVNQTRKFFVEAKRPSVNIRQAKSGAYQLRRYCWSATLPFGLLTDFEEFAIYDCRAMPLPEDRSSVARIAYFTYKDLPKYWPLLASMFGKAAVVNGSLDEIAALSKEPTNARPIDGAFLSEISGWREALAEVLAVQNPALDVVELNQAVQTLIDRIIFLRIAEARGLEPRDELKNIGTETPGVYKRLTDLFLRADDRYNSGLFHLTAKPEVSGDVDKLTPSLEIPDDILRRIITRLYFPVPYEFSVLPADLLGRIYEQFLGERIVLGENRKTTIELKPEVRKSGGVYYTPAPIVDYIVEKTVGPLLLNRSPKELENVRVLDPACGSGSFLIAAYQYLIDWHRDYYADKPRLAKQYLTVGTDGFLRLNTAERKRILINNIFGVDIDPQAVEVSKLSLLLKVVEGENQMELAVGRILPDLDANILCGNSLIDVDFQMPFGLTEEERLQFNPFSWTASWPHISKTGGFDAIIGNPPYLNIDAVWGRTDPRVAYIKTHYGQVYQDKTDILFYFLKKATELCKGEIGFIVSRSFLEADKAQNLRGWLGSNVRVREVLDFRQAIVFPKVGINTAIVRLTHSRANKKSVFRRWNGTSLPLVYTAKTLDEPARTKSVEISPAKLGRSAWNFGTADVERLLTKLDAAGDPVGKLLHVGQGMQTGRNSAFVLDVSASEYGPLHQSGFAYERLRNSDIGAYMLRHSGVFLAFPNAANSFESLPTLMQSSLRKHEAELKERAAYIRGNCEWWQYTWPLHQKHLGKQRIFCPYRATSNRFGLDANGEYLGITDTTVLYDQGQSEDILYVLGLLNSDALTFRFRFIGKLLGGGVLEYYENTVSKLPIPRRSPGDADHDAIVELVERRIEATSDLTSTKLHSEQELMRAVIAAIDQHLNDAIYGLFDLTSDERELISSTLPAPADDA